MREFAAILVVGDEEVFSAFLEQFPAGRYSMLFAVDEEETVECLDTGEAFLVVMSVAAVSPKLSRALRQSRTKGSVVLGLSLAGAGTMLPDLADWIVPRDNGVEVVADAARELLEERRRWPRAAIQLPLQIGPASPATATIVSARSMFVPTPRPLKMGERLQVDLDVETSEPLSCLAMVVRIGRGDSGQRGVVFAVPDEAAAVRTYLERLVRDALRIEHELQGTVVAAPPGAVAASAGAAGGDGDTAPPDPAADAQPGDDSEPAGDTGEPLDQDAAESTPLVDELKSEIWLLKDEAIRHQARLAAALASAAKDREELQKERGALEERMRALEAALEREQQRARAAAAGAPTGPGAAHPAPTSGPAGAEAAHPAPVATRPAPLQDRLQALRSRIVKSGPSGSHPVVAPPADGAGDTAADMPALPSRTAAGFEAVAASAATGAPAAAEDASVAPPAGVAGDTAAAAPASPSRTIFGFAAVAAPSAAAAPAAGAPPAREQEAASASAAAEAEEPDWDSTMVDAGPKFAAAAAPVAPPGVAPATPPAPASWPPALAAPPPYAGYPAAAPPAPYAGYSAAPLAPAPYAGYPAPVPAPEGSQALPQPAVAPAPMGDVAVPIDVEEPVMVPRRRRWPFVAAGVGAVIVLGVAIFIGERVTRSSGVGKGAVVIVPTLQADAAPGSTPPAPPPEAATAADAAAATAALAARATDDASAAPVVVAAVDAGTATAAAAAVEAAPADAGAGTAVAAGTADAAAAPTAAAPTAAARATEVALTPEARRKLKQKEREGYIRRGWELIERNDQQRAREVLTRALKMADDPAVRDMLALSHRRSGELWPAAHHMERAAATSAGAARARRYVNLGALYAQLGKKSDACRAYRAALSAVPGHAPAQKQLDAQCPGGVRPSGGAPPAGTATKGTPPAARPAPTGKR